MKLQNSRRSKYELRCICRYQPLLAVYGTDSGKLYVHVKIYKGNRLYGELVVTDGRVSIHCRDCARWHKITIRQPGKAELTETKRPEFLPQQM
jgi:hypothetical protein